MISPANISALLTLAVVLAVTTTPLISASGGFCPDKMATLGGVHDSQSSQNSAEIDSLARFAVDEHNKKGVKTINMTLNLLFFIYFISVND